MIFNDCWLLFIKNIQSQDNRDFDNKMRAINLGNNYLATRIVELLTPESYPGEMKAGATNLSNDTTSNKFELPSDYLDLLMAWYKDGTAYQYFTENQRYDFKAYQQSLGNYFFDTTYTGTPSIYAINEPYLYTDVYFTSSGTDNVKIDYIKIPAILNGYSRITIPSLPVDWAVGETVTGAASSAVGIIAAKGSTYLDCLINDVSGEFTASEVLSCTGSVLITTVTTYVQGNETLMLGYKYKSLLIEAWALQWHVLKGSDEIESRSNTVDTMIYEIAKTNRIVPSSWGY